jgi:hypothetical protein
MRSTFRKRVRLTPVQSSSLWPSAHKPGDCPVGRGAFLERMYDAYKRRSGSSPLVTACQVSEERRRRSSAGNVIISTRSSRWLVPTLRQQGPNGTRGAKQVAPGLTTCSDGAKQMEGSVHGGQSVLKTGMRAKSLGIVTSAFRAIQHAPVAQRLETTAS